MGFKNKEDKRAYHRRWSSEHPEVWERVRFRNTVFIRKAKEVPCTDCGKTYPYYVMDFDHTGIDKERNLSRLANSHWSIERIKKEIEKCDVVCSNCHRIRTFERMNQSVNSKPMDSKPMTVGASPT